VLCNGGCGYSASQERFLFGGYGISRNTNANHDTIVTCIAISGLLVTVDKS
jgi:hypothetical protein